MTAPKRRWLVILAGVCVLVGVVAAGVAAVSYFYFRDRLEIARGTSRSDALARFEAERQRFGDRRPLLVMGDDRRPRYADGVPEHRNGGDVETFNVLAWDADDGALVSVSVPMWLLRMKSGPISFGEYVSGMDEHGVRLGPDDLQRYGPGVLLDIESPDGDLVLLTAQARPPQ
jgi:hypothetical protein